MGILDYFNMGDLGFGGQPDPARKARQQAAYKANVTGSQDPKLQERFLAEQRLGGVSEAAFGLPDLLNMVANAGIRNVDYWTGGGLSGGSYNPYQFGSVSGDVNTLAAQGREALTGTQPVAPETMPKDVQQTAANQRGLMAMIPTGAEDVATSSIPLFKATFAGIKKAGTPEQAQELLDALDDLAKGTPAEQVKSKYGWEVDPVGKYPFTEISDVPMALKPAVAQRLSAGKGVSLRTLGTAIDHPELFKAYPGLANVKVELAIGPYGGSFDRSTNTIKVSAPQMGRGERDLEALLMHEVQHAIQKGEGWPGGSNLTAGAITPPFLVKAQETAKQMDKDRRKAWRTYMTSTGDKSKNAFRVYRELGDKQNALEDEIRVHKAYEYYRRQPGEVQARNVQKRFNLTDEELRQILAAETHDVPYSEQVKTFNTGFGKPKGPLLDLSQQAPAMDEAASLLPGGVLREVDQAFDPAEPAKPKKLTKAQQEAEELKRLTEETTGLFDMTAKPAVTQQDIARFQPPKGVPQRILDITSNPDVRKKMLAAIEKGRTQYKSTGWYNLEPLRKVFIDEFGAAEGDKWFERYTQHLAGASPKSEFPENVRNASYYYGLDYRGEPLPEPVTDPVTGKTTKNPAPYGSMAQDLHRSNFEKITGPGFDIKKNPKPRGFQQDLYGNLRPVAVDQHAFNLPAMLAEDPRFLSTSFKAGKGVPTRNIQKELAEGKITMAEALRNPSWWEGKPKETEYAAMERYYQDLAKEAGLEPGEAQANAWTGGGDITGLKSPPDRTAMETFIDRVALTAQKRGLKPKEVIRQMMRAENPLLALSGLGLLPLLYQSMQDKDEGGLLNRLKEEG